jgi:hypothetical protein
MYKNSRDYFFWPLKSAMVAFEINITFPATTYTSYLIVVQLNRVVADGLFDIFFNS